SERDIRIALQLWWAYQAKPGAPGHLSALLMHLGDPQAALHSQVARFSSRTAARPWQVLARMQRARMKPQAYLHRPVQLAELAALSRFSEWWVSKTYHAIYGEPIQESFQRMRMQRARALLEHTDLSISEIGEACGFPDPCSLARLFKQRHGQPASLWRAVQQAQRQELSSQPPALPDVGQAPGN